MPSNFGGIDVVETKLATFLSETGDEVTCYLAYKPSLWSGGPSLKRKRVFTIHSKATEAITYSFFATLRARFGKYDIVHFHGEGYCLFLWMFNHSKKKIIVTIHGLNWQDAKFKGLGSKLLLCSERMAVKKADEIITVSPSDTAYFLNKYGRATKYIPNGFDSKSLEKADLITQKFSLFGNDYLLFLSRLVPEKGAHYLIDAFKCIESKFPNVKLVIAGNESFSNGYYQTLKKKAEGDTRIIFTGFVEGKLKAELFSNALFYILPSESEGMPLALLEAFGYRKICIASDIPGCKLWPENTYFFKSKNIESLVSTITKALDEKRPFSDVDTPLLSWEQVFKETTKVYREMTSSKK